MLLDRLQGHFGVRKSGNTHIGLPVVQFGWIPICYIRTYISQGAFVTRIKIFDQQKVCLIAWSALLRPLIAWFFMDQRSKCWPLIFAVRRSPWSLDWLSKSALITWFYFDPSRKRFYTGHISDYPLSPHGLVWAKVTFTDCFDCTCKSGLWKVVDLPQLLAIAMHQICSWIATEPEVYTTWSLGHI